jgi:hypothetical protein
VDRPTRPKVRGFGPVALVAVLVLGFFFGAVPVWQYVDAHRVPGDADAQQATVTGFDRGPRGSDRGTLVRFTLPDESEGSVYFESRFGRPDRGDTIDVYRSGGRWHSPAERSFYGLVSGIGALLLFGLLALGWFRVRRRRSLAPVESRRSPPSQG